MTRQLNKFVFGSLVLLWFTASYKYMDWFFSNLNLHFDLIHIILLLGILFLWFHGSKPTIAFKWKFYKNSTALILSFMSFGVLLFIKSQSSIRIFGFAASIYLLYAIAGLVIHPDKWKKGLIPLSLLVMTLPFGRHLDVFVGYPLRVLSAEISVQVLSRFVPDIDSVSSILILENRASQVDMDCSGLRGLWVAMIVFFSISWIEKSRLGFGWLLSFSLMLVWLIAGNIVRIILLCFVNLVWEINGLDIWIHHLISIFFLLTACGVVYMLLHYKVSKQIPHSEKQEIKEATFLTRSTLFIYSIGLLAVILVPAYNEKPRPELHDPVIASYIESAGWNRMELQMAEQNIFKREGVQGYKFRKNRNELILILNGDWRSQHKPELCYELSGFPLKNAVTSLIETGFPIKTLEFKNRKEKAYFWFQSGEYVTEDFATKVWQQIKGDNRDWSLISLLNHDGNLPVNEIKEIHQILNSKTHLNYE